MKDLLIAASKIFSGRVLETFISVIATVVVTRMLGPDGRGVYAWIMTLAAIGTQMAIMGCNVTCRKVAAQNPQEAPKLINYALSLGLLGSIPVALICFAYAMSTPIGSGNITLLIIALICIPFWAWSTSFSSIFIGVHQAGKSAQCSLYSKVLLVGMFGVLILSQKVNLYNIMGANFLAAIIGTTLGYFLFKKLMTTKLSWDLSYLKGLWRYSLSAYVAGILYFVMNKVDIIMLGNTVSKADTGFYSLAASITDIMITPATAIGMILMAKLSSETETKANKRKLHRNVYLFTIATVSAGCLFTAFIAPYIIPFAFGEDFMPAVRILQILCPAVLLLSLYLIEQNKISATGRARYMLIAPTIGAVSNIGLNLYLIPLYGTTGAAIASITAYGLAWLSLFITARRVCRLNEDQA